MGEQENGLTGREPGLGQEHGQTDGPRQPADRAGCRRGAAADGRAALAVEIKECSLFWAYRMRESALNTIIRSTPPIF